jgi:2'-5' RNA ligase
VSLLCVRVPHEIARALSGIEIPGEKEPVDHFHISVLYLGKDTPVEQLMEAATATYEVTSKFPPFTVQTGRVSTFPRNPDDGTPIIARMDSLALHELQGALKDSFKEKGVTFSDKYPDYKPHVTLGYNQDEGVEIKDQKIDPPVQWGVGELTLWGGDVGDERLYVTFPLSVPPTKAAMQRIASKLALARTVSPERIVARFKNAHDENGYCDPNCPCHKKTLAERIVTAFLQR